MVDISYAHVNSGMARYLTDIDEVLKLAEAGAKVVVPTTTQQTDTDLEQWPLIGAPEEFARRQNERDPRPQEDAYRRHLLLHSLPHGLPSA